MTGKQRKIYERLLRKDGDANAPLKGVEGLLRYFGFDERVRSSHRYFTKPGVKQRICLQDSGGGKCKPYQVRQVREVFLSLGL